MQAYKNIDEIIFINNLPTLDLHGFDRETARVYINDFIKENKKLKNSFFIIVHGIGSGIIKHETQKVLMQNKDVINFKLANFNEGCTIVQIKIDFI